MQPGDLVGITSIHDVMRKATQSNLSSFHEAGLESTGKNIPIQGTLDVSSSNRIGMYVKADDDVSFRREYLHRKLGYYIVGYETSVYLDEDHENFWGMNAQNVLVRLYTSYKKLLEDCRSLKFIKEVIMSKRDYIVVVSSDFVGIIDVVEKHPTTTPINKKIYDILDIDFGIDNILDFSDGITSGSNLDMISRLTDIDGKTLKSNDIRQVENRFGIEAARNVIFEMIKDSSENSGVIADYMTWHGKVFPFNKFSPDQNKGTITSMGFERPNKDIIGLSKEETIDDFSYVYSQMALGMKPKVGSNSKDFDVIEEEF